MDSPDSLRSRHPLGRGRHPTRDGALCTMELVAWLAGEPHGDEPRTACPVLTALVRAANDLVPDARRDALLRPIAPQLVRSRVDAEAERIRAWIAADTAGRFLSALRLVRLGRAEEAEAIRLLPRIDGPAQAVLAAAHLARSGSVTRAVRWTLRQAADGQPPTVWIPGVVHAVRDAGAWSVIPRLVADMLTLRVAVR